MVQTGVQEEDSLKCPECPVCPTEPSSNTCVDRYDEGYKVGYDAGFGACPESSSYDVASAAALCQKQIDAEYQKGYQE